LLGTRYQGRQLGDTWNTHTTGPVWLSETLWKTDRYDFLRLDTPIV